MKAIIKNWNPETLNEKWFTEHGQERDSDRAFLEGKLPYPLAEIPFFFTVECSPAAFILFMGQLLGAAVSGEIEIVEPETGLPLL